MRVNLRDDSAQLSDRNVEIHEGLFQFRHTRNFLHLLSGFLPLLGDAFEIESGELLAAITQQAGDLARQSGKIHFFEIGQNFTRTRLKRRNRRGHRRHRNVFQLRRAVVGRIVLRVQEIELHKQQSRREPLHPELRPQAPIHQGLQLPAVGHVDRRTLRIRHLVLAELTHHRDDRKIPLLVIADAEIDHAPHGHTAQLHRRAQSQTVDRLVEIHHKSLRFRKKAHSAKRQQSDHAQRKRADDESADDGWADLGFHG